MEAGFGVPVATGFVFEQEASIAVAQTINSAVSRTDAFAGARRRSGHRKKFMARTNTKCASGRKYLNPIARTAASYPEIARKFAGSTLIARMNESFTNLAKGLFMKSVRTGVFQ
jgi:hypothetical protein